MEDRFKFRVVVDTERFCILIEPMSVIGWGKNIMIYCDVLEKALKRDLCEDDWDSMKKAGWEWQDEGSFWEIEDFSLLKQSIGQKDREGILIFEGNILEDEGGLLSFVVWSGVSFGVQSYGSQAIDFEDESFYSSSKIIGNIYENKQLLMGAINENRF